MLWGLGFQWHFLKLLQLLELLKLLVNICEESPFYFNRKTTLIAKPFTLSDCDCCVIIRLYKNVPNKLISIFVIASSIETKFFESLNSWLKQIVFISHFMMEVDNLIPTLGGYNLEIFGKNDVEKYKCYICRKVMKDAIQLPHLVHPKRTCLTCYTANIR